MRMGGCSGEWVGWCTSGATACALFPRGVWHSPSPFPVSVATVIMDLCAVAVAGLGAVGACRRVPCGPGASRCTGVTQILPCVVATARWPSGLARVYIRCCLSLPPPLVLSCLLGLPGLGACSILPSTYCGHPWATAGPAPRLPRLPPSFVSRCAALFHHLVPVCVLRVRVCV